MKDPRIQQLARNLVEYSTEVKKGDRVLIEAIDLPPEFVECLVEETARRGGLPTVWLRNNRILRSLYRVGTDEQMKLIGECERYQMERTDVYIGARGVTNMGELSDVSPEHLERYQKLWFGPVHMEVRVPKTRWVVMRWPTSAMAQAAGKSTEAFEDFYFDVCCFDYGKMSKAMDPLKELLDRTDRVHIKGPGETDLRFSIKGMNSIKCDGKMNIPDGEVYTAPVKDSIEGVIAYNTPSLYQGTEFKDIRFVFREGRIVEATCNEPERINGILDTDEGARSVGEFAIGVNPYITDAMKDTLFDEKIRGSFHFTPGNSYEDCDNGNHSAIHWDLVAIQTPDFGGGEIWFDDVLIRKDGLFVLPELLPLNPDSLIG
jgi:aminopeptidase